MKKHGAKRISKFDATIEVVNIVFLSIIAVIILYPLIYVLSASFSDAMSVTSGKMFLWPVDLTLENYEEVFKNKNIVLGFRNSIIIMVSGTVINLLMTILAAYPLSRRDLWGHSVIMKLITFTMFFNGGLIPSYLLIGKTLGLMDNWLSLILPGAISVYNMIIMRTYFMTSVPFELQEAAEIDGCSMFGILARIVLPLSGPVIAVIALYYAVGHWNSYFNAPAVHHFRRSAAPAVVPAQGAHLKQRPVPHADGRRRNGPPGHAGRDHQVLCHCSVQYPHAHHVSFRPAVLRERCYDRRDQRMI